MPQKPSEPKPWERILTEDDTKVDLRIEPAPIEWLLKDLLPAHVFGATVAQGGVGKTNFWLRLAYHLAAGEPWGPFIPTRPCKVLMLCGEDPPEVIAQRLWTIGRGHYPSNFHVKSVLGSCGPLVEYGNNGNLQPSHWFGWLEKTVEAHKNLDLLIIDPRSRFYGVEENDNDMATQWVSLMEGLQTRRGNATQCTHHIAKAKAGSELSQGMSRGASAFTDGVRLVWAMGEPDEKMVAKRAESDPQLIKFRVVKNNYGPKPKKEFYFEVGEGGLLEPVDPQSEVQMIIQMVIPKALSMVRAPLTRRDILRQDGEAAKAFLEVIRDDVEGATKEDVDRAIKDMLYHRKIFERERPSTGRGPGKKILSLLAQDIGENA